MRSKKSKTAARSPQRTNSPIERKLIEMLTVAKTEITQSPHLLFRLKATSTEKSSIPILSKSG